MRALVAGASGFVGRSLVPALVDDGVEVCCVVRDVDRAQGLDTRGCDVLEADLSTPVGLEEALCDVDVAYFLVHMMGRVSDYAEQERLVAAEFARLASAAAVKRVVYLGGLGDDPGSTHLESRRATAEALRELGPPLTYFRAAMIIGPGSESYELLRGIVRRLFVLPAPDWLETTTQPIGIRDVVSYLRQAPVIAEAAGREIQIGGPEVLTHLQIVDEMARQLGEDPPPRLDVSERIATPEVIAAGAAAVTPGNKKVASEISLGLPIPTHVTDPSGSELFEIEPESLAVALQRAIEDDERERVSA